MPTSDEAARGYRSMCVSLCEGPAPDQSAALHTALHTIRHWRPAGYKVEISGATMSDGLAAVLTAAAAAGWDRIELSGVSWPLGNTAQLPRLRRLELQSPLTDAVLAELRRCVSWADELDARGGLQLQAPLPAGTVLPWGAMTGYRLADSLSSLKRWLEQAELLGGGAGWKLYNICLSLTSEVSFTDPRRVHTHIHP